MKEKNPAKRSAFDKSSADKPADEQKQNIEIGYIKPREIVEEMRDSYIDYAMSVIVSRALPDVRDGLKPVHRRILYAMYDMGLTHMAKFRKSATVVGECFVKDTLVLTDKGLLPIQNIKVGDNVYTQNGLNNVSRLYEMPPKDLLKVTLGNGLFNVVTPLQKFKVLTPEWKYEWKNARDLTENDYLILKADYPKFKNYGKLKASKEERFKYLNEDIAYLLGFFVSEGSISNDYGAKRHLRITFTNGSKETMLKIASILQNEFGYSPKIENKYQSGKCFAPAYTIRINRLDINNFFVENFNLNGKKALTKEIPQKIFFSPSSVVFSFISGLMDGDGSIHNKERNSIHYGSVSPKLIQQLQILLLHHGIFSNKYKQNRMNLKRHYIGSKEVKSNFPFYSLEIRGEMAIEFAKKLSLQNLKRRQRVEKLVNKKYTNHNRKGFIKYDIIPYAGKMLFQELSNKHIGSGWYQDAYGENFRMGIKYPDGTKIRYALDLQEKPLRKTQIIEWGMQRKLGKIGSPLFEFLADVIKNKIYFVKVSSIKEVAPEKTYDIEVEGDHEFIANGVISHNCLGKYHPHSDVAVYDSLVRMAQDFSLRYPLVQGQGNFGSIDGDISAAMRYTECRLPRIGEETLRDIEKNTVNLIDNYDGTRKEPVVLPSPLPQLLLNGSLGIAVGMATNIPPHNLSEVVDATIHLINHPNSTTEDLFEFIKGPDFPTGGLIYDQKGIIEAYSQGKGPIVNRGRADVIGEEKGGKTQIIIKEIPFQVQKSSLIEQIANLVQEKRIDGIRNVRDESDREGMRIVIELNRDAYPQKTLNQLYKFTDLQRTFHLNMLALVDGIQPRVLNLAELLTYFIEHRKDVIYRRTQFDLTKAKERAHILEGLAKALAKIDAVIKTIRASRDRDDARKNLMKRFKLTGIQANAILEMRLQQLARLEREKIEEELEQKLKEIKELTAILKSPQRIKEVVKKELLDLKASFGDERKTKVYIQKIGEIAEEDLVPQEETILTLTQGGYIKRINPSVYKIQRRGGKGLLGMKTLQDDTVEHFLTAMTHDSLLFFTDSGKVFRTQAYEIPEGTRVARGRGLLNFLEISQQEKVLSLIPYGKDEKQLGTNYLVMVTQNGIIKKTSLDEFENVRRSGLIAITLKKDDLLKKVCKSSGEDEAILVTRKGQSIRFKEKTIRPMGRPAAGIKGIRLKRDDQVIGMDIIQNQKLKTQNLKLKEYLLIVTENGYGKRTDVKEYRLQGRGGSGIKTAQVNPKTGQIVSSRVLSGGEEDLIVISRKGQVIRTLIKSIPVLGRATQGVRIMRLEEGDHVASAACI